MPVSITTFGPKIGLHVYRSTCVQKVHVFFRLRCTVEEREEKTKVSILSCYVIAIIIPVNYKVLQIAKFTRDND